MTVIASHELQSICKFKTDIRVKDPYECEIYLLQFQK